MKKSLHILLSVSEQLGRDPHRIQGPGGNTSLKHDGVLWVKGSGTWLADAATKPIFLALDHERLVARLRAGVHSAADAVIADLSPPSLRPSIETALHALIPHPVVIHTHSVGVIAQAVRTDGHVVCAERLSGLNWAWIPYASPGRALAEAVQCVLPLKPDVLILANHGVVVGAADANAGERLLTEVEGRLSARLLPLQVDHPNDLTRFTLASGWKFPTFTESHQLAFAHRAATACAGSLYPDHVVFLGRAPVPTVSFDDLTAWLAKFRDGTYPAMVMVPEHGVLVRAGLSDAAQQMVRCLALVAGRLDSAASVNYLRAEEERALLLSEMEAFRQAEDTLRMS